jgi:hypothetical protein
LLLENETAEEAFRRLLPDDNTCSAYFSLKLEAAYLEITGWCWNLFLDHSGSVSKSFVKKLTRLIDGYAEELLWKV